MGWCKLCPFVFALRRAFRAILCSSILSLCVIPSTLALPLLLSLSFGHVGVWPFGFSVDSGLILYIGIPEDFVRHSSLRHFRLQDTCQAS